MWLNPLKECSTQGYAMLNAIYLKRAIMGEKISQVGQEIPSDSILKWEAKFMAPSYPYPALQKKEEKKYRTFHNRSGYLNSKLAI